MGFKIIFSHYGVIDGGDASGFTRSFALSSGLALLGNDVTFLTTQNKGFVFPYLNEKRDGVSIVAFPDIVPYRLRKGGVALLSAFLKIIYILFHKADVVQADMPHRPTSGLPCIIHRRLYGSKYVAEWWEHYGPGGIYDEMPNWYRNTIGLFDKLFEERSRIIADACVPISHQLFKRAVEIGINEEKMLILNGGSDVRKISFYEHSSEQKEKFDLPVDNYIIAIIGINDDEFKNNLNLINAIVKHNTLTKGRKITIIGTGQISKTYENPIYNNCIKIFKWLKYEDFCNLISAADAFSLILSDSLRNISRFPNKLGDYLASGRPIFANRIGEVDVYMKKYPWIFYDITNDDINELLCKITEDDDNLPLNLKIRFVAEANSWEQRAIQLNNLYKKLINQENKKQ